MPVLKAKKIIASYNRNGMNASKALEEIGYKRSTATKKSKEILDRAMQVALSHDVEEVVESSMSPRNKMLAMLGITKEDVFTEYLKIVLQDKDFTNKLKALQPLLATQGIKWNEEQQNISPTLNLTVKSNNIDNPVKNIVEQSAPRDIEHTEMAQQSDETERVAQYTLSTNEAPRADSVVNAQGEASSVPIAENLAEGEGGGVDSLPITVKEGISPP